MFSFIFVSVFLTSFLFTAITNRHKFSALKQHRFVTYCCRSQKSRVDPTKLRLRYQQAALISGGSKGSSSSFLYQLLEATWNTRFMVSFHLQSQQWCFSYHVSLKLPLLTPPPHLEMPVITLGPLDNPG